MPIFSALTEPLPLPAPALAPPIHLHVKSIPAGALLQFCNQCFHPVKHRVAQQCVHLIARHRQGTPVQLQQLRSAVEVFYVLGQVEKNSRLPSLACVPSSSSSSHAPSSPCSCSYSLLLFLLFPCFKRPPRAMRKRIHNTSPRVET